MNINLELLSQYNLITVFKARQQLDKIKSLSP